MPQSLTPDVLPPPFPNHTQLPESDGRFSGNFQKHPRSLILTESIGTVLQRLSPVNDVFAELQNMVKTRKISDTAHAD